MNKRAPLFAALGAVVVLLIFSFAFLFPKGGQVKSAEEDLDGARGEELSLRQELARLEATRQDAPRIRRELATLRRLVPPVADLPGLINQLQGAANESRVDFFAVSPQVPSASEAGPAVQVPTQVQVIGGFFAVDEFLFLLETLPRAAKITTVDFSAGPDGLPDIQVIMAVTFFTTDTSAGPGAPVESPTPEPSPTPTAGPGETPTAGPSPSPGG